MSHSKYTYMTLLTNDSYFLGVILLAESLRRVNSEYPLMVMITDNVSKSVRDNLRHANINYIVVDAIGMPEKLKAYNTKLNTTITNTWADTFTKLRAWTFTNYDRIVMLDCDIMINKNIDHLFENTEFTAALDGEYFNLWPTWPHFNSGCMVITPNIDTYKSLMQFVAELDPLSSPEDFVDFEGKNYVIADQEALNIYFKQNSIKVNYLSKYYNIFACHASKTAVDDILDNGYFIHFVGIKPWIYRHNDFINADLSVTSYIDMTKNIAVEFYIIASTIIAFSQQHNFSEITANEWREIDSSGQFYDMAVMTASDFYCRDDISRKYAELSFAITQDESTYRARRKFYEAKRLNRDKLETLIKMLEITFDDCMGTDFPTMPLYMDIQTLLKWKESDVYYNRVDELWALVTDALKAHYTDKLSK